jgi:hypothetical protein
MQNNNKKLTEFRFSRKKFILNLLKLRRKMKKFRKKAENLLSEIKIPQKPTSPPDSKTIIEDLKKICSVPHRRVGTKEAHEIEEYLINQFKELGLKDIKRDPINLINWHANNWKLIISTDKEQFEIPCFYVLNTEFTNSEGITAPLVYVRTGEKKDFKKKDVKGKIVVADIEFPEFPIGKILKLAPPYYVSDPTNSIDKETSITLTFALLNFPPQALGGPPIKDSVYWRAVDNGAVGLILILRDYPSNVNTHWGPYDGSMKPVPALYVGKYDGIELREISISETAKATIILEGNKEPSVAHNIIGILPGQSDEMVMISSHHDAAFQGASEDGTGVSMVLAQLRAWANTPLEKRPRSLLFVLTAGHLYGGIGAEHFAHTFKNSLLNKVLVDVNLEHLCAKEVDEDPQTRDFKLTNNLAIGATFVSQNDLLIAHTLKAFKEHDMERMILIPDNFFATPPIGEAGHFAVMGGLKVIHLIRSPYYLLTAEDTLDKIDMNKLQPTAQCITDLINSLMYLPKEKF